MSEMTVEVKQTEGVTGENSISYSTFRWYIMAVMLVATAAQTVIMIAPAPMVEVISKALGLGVGPTTAIMMGTWNLVGPLGTIIAGFFVHRIGITKMLLLGCLLLIVPSLLYPVVGNSLPAIVVLRILQPFGVGPMYAIAVVLAATWFPPRQRSLVAGLQGFATSLGVAVGFVAAPAAYAATQQNWLAMMAYMALVPALGFIMTLVIPFGPEPPHSKEEQLDAAAMSKEWKMATKERVFYIGIAVMFLLCWCFVSFNDLTPGYFAVSKPMGIGYGPAVAGKLMTTVQIAFMVGAALLGPIFEKVFKENARNTMTVGFLLFAVFAISIRFPFVYSDMTLLPVILALAGFFEAWIIPCGVAFVALHYPAHLAGRINGLWFGIGLFAGVPAIGVGSALLSKTGSYNASIYVVTAVAVVGAIVARFMIPPKSFRQSSGGPGKWLVACPTPVSRPDDLGRLQPPDPSFKMDAF